MTATLEHATATVATHPELPGITGEFILVTPEIAASWLEEFNTENRKVKVRHEEKITRDMANDDFVFNGASIVFYRGEVQVLGDGQHRLLSIIESGKAQLLFVWHGIDPAVRPTIDDNKSRTAADDLYMLGFAYANDISALAKRIWDLNKNKRLGASTHNITKTEVAKLVAREPEIARLAAWASLSRKQAVGMRVRSPAIGILKWELLTHSDAEAVGWFLNRFIGGDNLPGAHPIMSCRRIFLRQNQPGGKLAEDEQIAFLIYAWNAVMEGREITRFQRRGENEPTYAQKMPERVSVRGDFWKGLITVPMPSPEPVKFETGV